MMHLIVRRIWVVTRILANGKLELGRTGIRTKRRAIESAAAFNRAYAKRSRTLIDALTQVTPEPWTYMRLADFVAYNIHWQECQVIDDCRRDHRQSRKYGQQLAPGASLPPKLTSVPSTPKPSDGKPDSRDMNLYRTTVETTEQVKKDNIVMNTITDVEATDE